MTYEHYRCRTERQPGSALNVPRIWDTRRLDLGCKHGSSSDRAYPALRPISKLSGVMDLVELPALPNANTVPWSTASRSSVGDWERKLAHHRRLCRDCSARKGLTAVLLSSFRRCGVAFGELLDEPARYECRSRADDDCG